MSPISYSTPRTWVSGEYPTAAQFNANIRDNIAFLANPPSCRVYNSANISVPHNAETNLTFNSERFDTDGMHSTASLTERITFTTAGLYVVAGSIDWVGGADFTRLWIGISLSGTTYLARSDDGGPGAANVGRAMSVATVYKFTAGQFVTLRVYQANGAAAARSVVVGGNFSPEFSATWVGLG